MEIYQETIGGESPSTRNLSRLPSASQALVPILDSPAAGTHTYELQVRILRAGNSASLYVKERGMSLIELKR